MNPKSNDPKLIYLDPHFVQDAIPSVKASNWVKLIDDAEQADESDSDNANVDETYGMKSYQTDNCRDNNDYEILVTPEMIRRQYHCQDIRTMSLSKICTSLTIGFYIRDAESFEKFKANLKELAKMPDSFFSIFEKSKTRHHRTEKKKPSREVKIPMQTTKNMKLF